MIKIVSSNFSLNARKAHYAYKKPFDILAKGLNYQIDMTLIDMFRKYLLENVA